MTTRRQVLAVLGLTAAAHPWVARSQPQVKMPHIGYLSTGSLKSNRAFLDALKDALRDLGYIDGKNVAIDVRWAGDMPSEFPQLAASLVRDNPNAIVTTCIPSTRAAKQATRTVPVVMSVDGDPVAAGLVSSLSRPGGNVTGTSTLFEELIQKWLELLHAATPRARDIAILCNPDNVIDPYYWAQFQEAAQRIGVNVVRVEARVPAELDQAFKAMKNQRADGLVVMTEAFLAGQVQLIVPLAERYKLPAIYGYREFADAGGLMSYGLSFRDYYKRVARYVDAVLKGAKPEDLPVEQPSRIELVINRATARKLGVAIPPTLLVRADYVID